MKATIFDGTSQRPFTPNDAQAVSASTPYVWIDVIPSGPKDPQVLALLKDMGFTEMVAVVVLTTGCLTSSMS